jgi:hypothetical protein
MPLPKLKFPALAAPGREVVLLPDDLFFVRSVMLASGPDAASVESQVELALEGLAPFPLSQLYYGYWTKAGADRVLLFAAYRKRFHADQVERWATADLVAPQFAVMLGAASPAPATAWVLTTAEGLTGVYFSDRSGVPSLVVHEPLADGADSAARTAARDRLLHALGGTRTVVDLPEVTVEPGDPGESNFVVRGGDLQSQLTVSQAEALDVRDKGELATRRGSRLRDRWMWRALVLGLLVLAGCAVLELVLVGLRSWQGSRLATVAQQTPTVSQIMTAQTLATRIEDLSTKRLMPREMIDLLNQHKPASIYFVSATSSVPSTGLYTLNVEAQTRVQTDIDLYRAALNEAPETERVVIEVRGTQNNLTTFRMAVTFKPAAFAASNGGAE